MSEIVRRLKLSTPRADGSPRVGCAMVDGWIRDCTHVSCLAAYTPPSSENFFLLVIRSVLRAVCVMLSMSLCGSYCEDSAVSS